MKKNTYEIIKRSMKQKRETRSYTGVYTGVLTDSAWIVLAQFGELKTIDGNPQSFTMIDLNSRLWEYMHFNTLRDAIRRLEKKALIRMYSCRGGRYGNAKMYVITGDGLKLWETYKLDMEMKNIIEKGEEENVKV